MLGRWVGSLARLLDDSNYGVVQLDRQGGIAAMNDSAAVLLSERDGLLEQGGFLAAREPTDTLRLQKLLKGALPKPGRPATGGSIKIRRRSGSPSLLLHASPVHDRPGFSAVAEIGAIVMIADTGAENRIDPVLVQQVLGLTKAETRVALSLSSGISIRDIAQISGRRESTVRWHTKNIFEKQGITRQAQLVRLVQALGRLP